MYILSATEGFDKALNSIHVGNEPQFELVIVCHQKHAARVRDKAITQGRYKWHLTFAKVERRNALRDLLGIGGVGTS